MKLKKMRTDRLICLNSKINGKQPPIEDRIYWAGGCLLLLLRINKPMEVG